MEVQFADALDHFTSGRVLDIHVVRCAELSPLNEAGHLNGAETSDGRSAIDAGCWRAEEFGGAQTKRTGIRSGPNECDLGGKYGGANINFIYSHPDLPPGVLEKSETINPAMRLARRAINVRWPMPMVKSTPMADQIVPVKVY